VRFAALNRTLRGAGWLLVSGYRLFWPSPPVWSPSRRAWWAGPFSTNSGRWMS